MKKNLLFTGLLLCAAIVWGEFIFVPQPLTTTNQDSITVVSWGMGSSFSESMAKNKAKNSAMMLMSQQANGQEFTYTQTNSTVNFTTSSGGTFSEVKELSWTPLSPREYLIVLSARTAAPEIDSHKALSYRVQTQTTALGNTLMQLSKAVVEELISQQYLTATELSGTIYYLDLQITHNEATNSFDLAMDVVIAVN